MKRNRIVYVDLIKVFLTCLVVAHHAGQAYGPTGGVWVLKDSQNANWLGKFFFVNASYMMGLYFFISGYFMVFSLNRKSKSQFIKDRLVRLGIPLFIFTFFVFLPFNYLSAKPGTGLTEFFLDTYFNRPPMATGHLWFVASLLVYSLIYVQLVQRTEHQQRPTKQPKPFRSHYLIIYIVLLTISSALVRLYYPIDTWRTWLIPVEVAHIPQYLSLFFLGALFNRNRWLESLRMSTGFVLFFLAIVAYWLTDHLSDNIKSYWLTESFIESLLCVGISMMLLNVFRHYGNRTNAVIQLISENAYGIYLFHVFIVIALQYWLLPWQTDANIKFIIVTVLGITLSLILSAIFRKIRFTRVVLS